MSNSSTDEGLGVEISLQELLEGSSPRQQPESGNSSSSGGEAGTSGQVATNASGETSADEYDMETKLFFQLQSLLMKDLDTLTALRHVFNTNEERRCVLNNAYWKVLDDAKVPKDRRFVIYDRLILDQEVRNDDEAFREAHRMESERRGRRNGMPEFGMIVGEDRVSILEKYFSISWKLELDSQRVLQTFVDPNLAGLPAATRAEMGRCRSLYRTMLDANGGMDLAGSSTSLRHLPLGPGGDRLGLRVESSQASENGFFTLSDAGRAHFLDQFFHSDCALLDDDEHIAAADGNPGASLIGAVRRRNLTDQREHLRNVLIVDEGEKYRNRTRSS